MLRCRFVLALVACLLNAGAAAGATPEPSLQSLLALPLSPGSVAVLVSHAANPEVQERLRVALQDHRPLVRAMAARVVFVTRSLGLVPAVVQMLQAEGDDEAASEMMRVVATFDPGSRLAWLQEQAGRRSSEAGNALVESLARSHPDLLATLVTGAQVPNPYGQARALVLSSVQHPTARTGLSTAARERGGEVWSTFLRLMHDEMVPVDGAVLKSALAAPAEDVRTTAAYYVATLAGHPDDVLDRGALEAAADGAEKEGAAAPSWESAYREISRRALGRPARPVDWATLVAAEPKEDRGRHVQTLNASLLGAERADVEALTARRLDGDEWYRSPASSDHPERRVQKARTLAPSIAHVLADLMTLFNCHPGGGEPFAAADVRYAPDGRPRVVRPAESRLTGECAAVAHTAFQLTIAPDSLAIVPGVSDGLYLPFTRAYLACVEQPLERMPTVQPGAIPAAPRPKTPFHPDYPKSLRPLAIRGLVRVMVEISSQGCARSVETIRSLHPLLDVEMLRTMLATAWQPAMLDDVPVPLRMEVGWVFKP